MKNKSIFNRISNHTLALVVFFLIFSKVIVYVLIKNDFIKISLGGGSDADYYNDYTLGYEDVIVNIWPVILRFFNDIGLYSRSGVAYFLLVLNLLVIPVLVAKISGLNFASKQKYYLYSFLLCLIYPTLFFYTLDIYRDVFMVFSFLVGCLIVKKSLTSSSFFSYSLFFILSVLIGLFLLALRPYLGYAFLAALFLWKIKLTNKRLVLFTILYFLALFVANYAGVFESLTEYRAGFGEDDSGSTLGLDFSNPAMFIPNFILSALGQLLGLYITNPLALVLLLVETIPFVFMLAYVIKNIRLADGFLRFLIIFFVLYASVWLIGNDNLGTAIRLRMYNYFAIYICFFYMLNLKRTIEFQQVLR